MKKITIITLVIVGIVIGSCESTTVQEIQPVVTNPTYNSNIKPIFAAKCVSCHSANGESPALTNYAEVKDAMENGDVQCRIEHLCGEVMPPSGKMQSVFIDMINNWKDQGYVEQ